MKKDDKIDKYERTCFIEYEKQVISKKLISKYLQKHLYVKFA